MTTPAGVPNLPAGALTTATLAAQLQDQSAAAHRQRAAARMPSSLFGSSTGGNPLDDLNPFGVITKIWAGVNSLIATADPADIQGPDDIPGLLHDFIEALPFVGQFVDLADAIQGNYTGTDETLRAIQEINDPMRKLIQLIGGEDVTWPTPEEVSYGWLHLHDATVDKIQGVMDAIYNAFANLGAMLDVNNTLGKVLDAVLGIFGVARSGSAKAVALEARIRQLESAANTITMDFTGGWSSGLPSIYTVRRTGGGAGDIGFDGKGNAVWHPSGAGNRTVLARYNVSALTVDNGRIQAILATTPQPYIFDDAYTYLWWRGNTAMNTMMRLRIGYDSIRLQAVVSDAVTNIGAKVDLNPKAGGELDIHFGDPAGSPRRFTVALNGAEIIDEIDGDPVTGDGAVSQIGAGYYSVGFGMETGNYLLVGQNIPAGLSVVTASEVL